MASMSRNTSNQIHTGSATSFGNANFAGGGHAFGSNSTVNNYHQGPDANELKEHHLITTLPHAQAGRKVYEYKKKSGPCFPGTRRVVLQKMKEWATDPNEFGMYVLSGLAGIGKSTVAYTIAAWADERHQLGAEFFFSRDEADRRSAKLFFTTIAYDLYRFNEELKNAIGEALITKGRSTGSPQEQLDALILDPLKPIRNALLPTLIVVDALDECDGNDARFVLTGLRQLVQALPSFKVILTTRPEALSNNDSTTQEGRKVFRLHDIEADVVNEDIRIYLKDYLSEEQVKERLPDLTKQWCASDMQVERLIQASGKLFIMASTAVRYILDTFSYAPDKQIKELLDAFAQGRTPFDNLVDFYTIILRNAVPANCRSTRLIERYQAIVGTIVLAQVPLSVHSIASLMHIDVDQIFVVLRQLQSVISVADNIPRAYHKSFVDYITDSKRCDDINLRIDPTKQHTRIARRCFEMMGKHLKFNILGLGIPARFMSNNESLAKDGISDEKLQDKIPLELRYTCAYWDSHLNSANVDDVDLVKELERFDNARMLLPWFEVLSLIRKLDLAPRAIRVALKVLKPAPSDLRQLLSDGQRFISRFYEIIERSALQTYYSALLFTPTNSLLYCRYIDEALHLHRSCITGIPKQWDALIANLRHGTVLNSTRFSLDSTMLVSWNNEFESHEVVLKLWDAVTGTPISTIKGGSSFAIANDFSTVASFEDNAIMLYNVDGSEQGTTLKTSAKVLEVAISSESLSQIAAGLSDGTVSLWDTRGSQNDKLMRFRDYRYCLRFGPFGDLGDYRYGSSLEFSATGARLAYLSANKDVVKLCNVMKGEFIRVVDLDWGSWGFVFSRDGSRIVTWQRTGVKCWGCGDGQPVGAIEKESPVHAAAISDDGSLLAIRCVNNVEVWCSYPGNMSQIVDQDLDVHEAVLVLLAFSTDDTLAIATNSDVKLYSVKNHSFISTLSVSSCSSLAFSPDCSRLAVGGPDRTLLLSNIRVDSSSPSSNQQESRRLIVFALSWNCSRIACAFADGAVELWETDGFPKRRIAAHRQQGYMMGLVFSPDGKQFASGSCDGTINLWDGEDGVRRADFRYSSARNSLLSGVEVSNSVLAAAGDHGISLWDCKTLDRIQDFDGSFWKYLSFSADGAFLAAADVSYSITVFDVTSHIAIATFEANMLDTLHTMTFLPDNSQLVTVWRRSDLHGIQFDSRFYFITHNLVSKKAIQGPSFEKLIQLPDMPLWHGVPVWVNEERGQYYLEALFSQHDDPVPVLWIPREFHPQEWVQRRSMIAIQCKNERVVLLRLPTTATGTAARAGYDGNQNTHVPTEVQEDENLEEVIGFTFGEFGSGSQRPGPLRHRNETYKTDEEEGKEAGGSTLMYTTATPPLPSQRQESPTPALSALHLNEPAVITHHPQRHQTPSQCWAPSQASPPHTGQVERGLQRLQPSSRKYEMDTTIPSPLPHLRRESPPPQPSALNSNELATSRHYYSQLTPSRSQYWAPRPASPPYTGQVERGLPLRPPSRRHAEMYMTAPRPLPLQRRESPAPPLSTLNSNELAASTYCYSSLTPTWSQYRATPDTEVSAGHVRPYPASNPYTGQVSGHVQPHLASNPHTGQVGRGPQQSRLIPNKYREYTTAMPPPPDGPWPRNFR